VAGWRNGTLPCTGRPSAAHSRLSPCAYPDVLPPIEYPGHFIVKRVNNAGRVQFKKRLVFIANALKQHPTDLEEVADGIWSVYCCRVLLGRIDDRDYIIGA